MPVTAGTLNNVNLFMICHYQSHISMNVILWMYLPFISVSSGFKNDFLLLFGLNILFEMSFFVVYSALKSISPGMKMI